MRTHLWVRAEQRANEERVGLTPAGARTLLDLGIEVTVEHSSVRAIPIDGYVAVGCSIADENSWPAAPDDALIFGLKELPEHATPLRHRHIMFGHAYKGQAPGRVLLDRLASGGGTLYDLEYLVDDNARRVAAFGYWAGFAGAAVAYHCWVAQQCGSIGSAVSRFASRDSLIETLRDAWSGHQPRALIIGALGRVGTGAADLCDVLGVPITRWDMAETASGGPFPEVLDHELFLNCILARPGCAVFVPASATVAPRVLRVIGDIACDPGSDFSPIKVYDEVTTWAKPARRVHSDPPLDVVAIDNLPSLLPVESSEDYAAQLLSSLCQLTDLQHGVWQRAESEFRRHL